MTKTRRDEIISRVMERVLINEETGCWEWQGPTSGNGRGGGYGRMCLNDQTVAVHLVVFTHYNGYVPGKKQIDHTCDNRICCNPHHLEMVSHKENQKRVRQKHRRRKSNDQRPSPNDHGPDAAGADQLCGE
jgi:hypothetical protein